MKTKEFSGIFYQIVQHTNKKAFLNKVLGERIHWRGSKEMGKKPEYITVFFYGQTLASNEIQSGLYLCKTPEHTDCSTVAWKEETLGKTNI